MSWMNNTLPPKIKRSGGDVVRRSSLPEGLWNKCKACEVVLYAAELARNCHVCPKCGYHHRLRARARIDLLLDIDGRTEVAAEVKPVDSLDFKDSRPYPQRLQEATRETGESDALVVIRGLINGQPLIVAAFEFDFMGGSMGSVLGERFVRGVAAALEHELPFVCVTASGGARMQEGLFSLLQMAKTTAILTRLAAARLPFISILADPTMGGVSASFSFLGDIVLAEPGALVGFAGPRVIEQTVRETLPEGFQRAEFLLEKGGVDLIVDRRQLKDKVAQLLALLQKRPVPQ